MVHWMKERKKKSLFESLAATRFYQKAWWISDSFIVLVNSFVFLRMHKKVLKEIFQGISTNIALQFAEVKDCIGQIVPECILYASVDLPLCPLLMLHPRTRRGQSLGSASEVPKFALTNQVITRGSSIWISKGRERVRRSCNCQAGMSFSFNPETQSAMATWLPHLITWISTLSMVLAGETSDTGD